MKYTLSEICQFVEEEDVKFIRLAFTDVMGKQKNVSIMPSELNRAFEDGISIASSAIRGFGGEVKSELLLHPDPSTISILPWRPDRGRVVRMFCSITHPDGTVFESDSRSILQRAIADAEDQGVSFTFGSEMEFYLFKRDENGFATKIPYDLAGYMDVSPDDKGENIRREICLTLEQMGICPESSHHEEGPGQNEIDFRYSDPLTAADAAVTFRFVVNTIAAMNGLCADFSPKPLEGLPGNGMHINISSRSETSRDELNYILAGILDHIYETTLFFNPTCESYSRFGLDKAPLYISWSYENRSQLARIPAAKGRYRRIELRSPDPSCNPYLAYALAIWSGLDGIRRRIEPPSPADLNLNAATAEVADRFRRLPASLKEACEAACRSEFIAKRLPKSLIDYYVKLGDVE